MDRRSFLTCTGALTLGGAAAGLVGCQQNGSDGRPAPERAPELSPDTGTWEGVRAQFELDPQLVHMAGLLLSSYPAPVREAIAGHRRALDRDPAQYVEANNNPLKRRVRRAAARYMGVRQNEIALTDSTTMGTALAITGLKIRADQEMLTARFDYHVTHQSIRFQAERSGASRREVPLYRDIQTVTPDEIVESLIGEIRPSTRLVTATWVHSSTGLLMPIRRLSDRIAAINKDRSGDDRVIFFVDGVHGLGVEDIDISDLGCDFFSAGTHKWMHGPRGTGVLWGHPRAHDDVRPTIPTFTRDAGWGGHMSPGGFKPFEHEWSMAEAFDFHHEIGRGRIRDRIHDLASQLKQGLIEMKHITLRSPLDDDLTAGIICFDVRGLSAAQASAALRRRDIIASDTPYSPSYARLTPGVHTSDSDLEATLRAVRALR